MTAASPPHSRPSWRNVPLSWSARRHVIAGTRAPAVSTPSARLGDSPPSGRSGALAGEAGGEDAADQTEQVSLPGDARLSGQYAEDHRAVHQGDGDAEEDVQHPAFEEAAGQQVA